MNDLRTTFETARGLVRAVDGVSFRLDAGETFGVVGESGSGKSVLVRTIMHLLPQTARVASSSHVVYRGRDLRAMAPGQLADVWGPEIAMVFQDPRTALNPVRRIGAQITTPMRHHLGVSRREARDRAIALLAEVGIPDPAQRFDQYPHELSGGMRQRVVIASALSCEPKLLIADEPTTALDVTVQRQILDLLARLQDEHGMAMILITHDMGVVSGMADRVAVMYAGQFVEVAESRDLFTSVRHPYTKALMDSIPAIELPSKTRLARHRRATSRHDRGVAGVPVRAALHPPANRLRFDRARARAPGPLEPTRSVPPSARRRRHHRSGCVGRLARTGGGVMAGVGDAHLLGRGESLMRIEDLVVEFPTRKGKVHAVSGISFDIRAGETLGLVGESGCGKSTTARALLHLPRPTSGSIEFDGTDLDRIGDKEMRRLRPNLQMIFQDPRSSLNARRSVRDIVSAGPRIWGWNEADITERVDAVLDAVGLDPELVGDRRPTTFSGGQCQRISIARALVMEPKLVICDEPVSALDVSVQAQILNVLADMKQRFGITLLFISHDLGVVKNISDRVIVMYLGRICEVATPDVLFERSAHPYTRLLVDSVPRVSTEGRQTRAAGSRPAISRRRSIHRAAAGSAPGARGPRRSVRRSSPRSDGWTRITSWPVTSR